MGFTCTAVLVKKTQLALKITLILYQSNIGFYKLLQIYQHAQRIQFYILQSSLTRKLTSSSVNRGFPDSSVGKESTCNAGDPVSTPRLGRSTGEGIGYPLQYPWASLVAQLVKKSAGNVGDLDSILGLERSPGEGKGYPLRHSDLENSMVCIVHGVAKSHTQLRDFHFHQLTDCSFLPRISAS